MPVNKKNYSTESGYFWYHFTPRKLPFLLALIDLVKFEPHRLSVCVCVGGGGGHPVLQYMDYENTETMAPVYMFHTCFSSLCSLH